MSLFAKLIGTTSAAAAATPAASAPAGATVAGGAPAAPAPAGASSELTEARVETALQAAHAEGVAEGTKAAQDRMNAVFSSDAGKANLPMAAWMLAETNASADAIIAKLASMPAAAAPVAAAPATATPAAAPAATQAQVIGAALATTPKVAITGANDGTDAFDADAMWKDIQGGASAGGSKPRTGN